LDGGNYIIVQRKTLFKAARGGKRSKGRKYYGENDSNGMRMEGEAG